MCVPGPPLVYYATLDFCCDDKYFDESANSKSGRRGVQGACSSRCPGSGPCGVGRSVTADAGGNVTKLDLSGTTSKLESKCLLIEPHYTSDLCCASQASLAPLEDAQV